MTITAMTTALAANCVLAATGFDSWPWVAAFAVLLIGAGAAWLLLRRRGDRRRAGGAGTGSGSGTPLAFAAIPLLMLALIVSGGVAPSPASATALEGSPASVDATGSLDSAASVGSVVASDGSGCATPTPSPSPTAGPAPTPTPTPTPTPPPTNPPVAYEPGADGIGDPYFPLDGNGGYDVGHYDLDLAFDPETGAVDGTATITATATQNLSAFNLDFDTRAVDGSDSIVISAVTVGGESADWSLASTQISDVTGQPQAAGSTDGDATPPRTELTVIPRSGIPIGSTITTTVAYSGVPILIDDAFGPAGVFPTDTGAVIVGQPRVAATWFPANDHPSDKATFSTRMTVPTGLQVIGNGRLAGTTETGDSTTWDWEMDEPMATYLATATVGEYDITTQTDDATGITYYDAIDPTLFTRPAEVPEGGTDTGVTVGDVAADIFGSEPEVITFLEQYFGPYPFTEAGGIAIGYIDPATEEDLPYALENQTRPIYPAWAFPADADASVVVHELAHQWYGDDLSMNRWADIWLNEGFATYAEWLWAEGQGGPTTQEQFDDYYGGIAADSPFWTVEVADPGAAGIFDSAVYYRGAMTLQALRTQVGDEAFFAIVKGWAAENAGRSVSTEQFTAYAEQVSGQDLDALFDTWLHITTKPPLG